MNKHQTPKNIILLKALCFDIHATSSANHRWCLDGSKVVCYTHGIPSCAALPKMHKKYYL